MNMEELQKKTDTDLTKHINAKREELRSLRFAASGSGMRDVRAMRTTRKEIAQALTELNRRTREGAKNAS